MKPLIKIAGGKFYLKEWIIERFPGHYTDMIYVEPFIGGGSVFLNKNKSNKEVINDIDANLIGLWKEVQNNPAEFLAVLYEVEYNQKTFIANISDNSPVGEYIRRRMSRGGLGKDFSASSRLRGGRNEGENAWLSSLKQIPLISKRLNGVIIENRPALEVIKAYDSSFSLQYIDCPYLHTTRTSKKLYQHEMSDKDHEVLLDLILSCKSKFVISGYASQLYNKKLKGWRILTKLIANHSGQTKVKSQRKECLWLNY